MRKIFTLLFLLPLTMAFAQVEGTWKLNPEAGAMGVGPGLGDVSWWSSNAEDVVTRACIFDDEYVFNADGSFNNVLQSETWVEGWQGMDPEGCGTPVAPHDGSNAATWVYDEAAGTLTVNGTGAYLGLAKVINGGELSAEGTLVPESVTYLVSFSEDGTIMTLDIAIADPGYWRFVFTNAPPVTTSPFVGTWKLNPEAGAMGVGPGLGDVSWWSSNAEDVVTRACIFDDEYVFNADGSFNNVLQSETWVEGWQGMDPEGCGTPVAPHDGSNAATWVYDEAAGTLTVNGTGAYLGLAKVINGGELSAEGTLVPESVTYLVSFSEDGTIMTLDIAIADPGYWRFVFTNAPPVTTSPFVGTWKFKPDAGAMGVGPGLGDVSWWTNNIDDVTTRACIFDDEYVFNADGSFNNVLQTETWVEPWQGTDPEACGAPVAPHDGSNAATWTYDEAAGTITVNGTGAFLGLAKVINGGELSNEGTPVPESITYLVSFSEDGTIMTLDIDYTVGYWRFVLTSGSEEVNTLNLPVTFNNDDQDYGLTDFGENLSEIIVDPMDAENKVAQSIKTAAAATWAGTTVGGDAGFNTPIPFTAESTTMSVRVYSPSAGLPVRLKVEKSGDPTISVETEAMTTVANEWETLVFDFSNEAEGTEALSLDKVYNKASIFFNFGTDGAEAGELTFLWDDMEFITTIPVNELDLPVTFNDNIDYRLVDFGETVSEIITDPDDASNNVVMTLRPDNAQTWAGTTVGEGPGLLNPVPFTADDKKMSVKVMSPAADLPILLKIETAEDAGVFVEVISNTTVANEWETIIFDYSDVETLDLSVAYKKPVIFFNFGASGADAGEMTFYWDDIKFVENSDGILENNIAQAYVFPNPATDVLNIKNSNEFTSLSIYSVTGKLMYQTNEVTSSVDVSSFSPGMYAISAQDANGLNYQSKFIVK